MTGAGRQRLARMLSAVVGVALVGVLAHDAGIDRVRRVLEQAAGWLPAVFALELLQMTSDVVALRWLLRHASRVPAATWVRSSAAAYAMMILLPAGRASGEITRAALLARHVGAPWAATAGAQMQASYLFANGVLSASACVAVASWAGMRSVLVLLLAANTLLMWGLSAALLCVLRGERAGRWLERVRTRFVKLVAPSPPLEPHARRVVPWRAAAMCTASRAAQVVQYGVLVKAVGGVPSVRTAFIAHGIHLVGSTVGDFLPNQLGAVDGAYRAFAASIGFSDAPVRALSIAFLAHSVQLTSAAACVAVAVVTRAAAHRAFT